MTRPFKLMFVVTEDWYFVSHRLPLAVAALEAGMDVVVATRLSQHEETIRAAGLRVLPLSLSRRGGNPFTEIVTLVRLFRHEHPDLVHLVALKPVVYGGIAALLSGIGCGVYAVAGLGWLFTSRGIAATMARLPMKLALSVLMRRSGWRTIVQNPDDRDMLAAIGVPDKNIRLIRGAGVDLNRFHPPVSPAHEPVTVMLAARLLWNKGVREFVEAARMLRAKGLAVRFVLVGDPDPGNPASIDTETIRAWVEEGAVEWLGHRSDMDEVYRQAHIACLPSSYGEGVPKTLLEAAAAGLPIVTTDAPGCREVVVHGDNGLLVPVHDVEALSAALSRLIDDSDLRVRMGKKSRARAKMEFDVCKVCQQTVAIYRELLA